MNKIFMETAVHDPLLSSHSDDEWEILALTLPHDLFGALEFNHGEISKG